MESILKAFTIGFLLRSLFAGIFFVISYYVASHGAVGLANIEANLNFSVALPVALFAGVTAYGILRSMLYPMVEGCFDSRLGKTCRDKVHLISDTTIEILLWRWNYPILGSTAINKHLNTWADIVHLQYASALCILLGALAGRVLVPGRHPAHWPLVALAVLFVFAALISDWRIHRFLDRVVTQRSPGGTTTSASPLPAVCTHQ